MYNSQIVRYLVALYQFHNAEYGFEDSFTLYHIIQEQNGRASPSTGSGPALPALGHAFAGGLASAVAKTACYPLDLIITRLQVQKQLRSKGEADSAARDADKEYTSLVDAAQKIYKTEGGLKAFYSGVPTEVSKGILDSFLFFLSYSWLRQYEQKRLGVKHLSVGKELVVGVAAGSFGKFFTTPIQNIVTRQQTAALVGARDPNSNGKSSVLDIGRQIHNERGIAGFWAGYSESVVLTINPAITFAVDNILTRLLPKARRDNPSPQVTFLIAALSKAIATTLTYPAMLAKSRAQVGARASGDEDNYGTGSAEILEKPSLNATPERRRVKRALQSAIVPFKAQYGILLALRKIYREEGLSGLYSGLEGEVLKGFIQHGLTMMVKERAQVAVIQLYYVLLKATQRWPEELQKAQANAKDLANDAQERAANVGTTISEGAKSMAEKATGSNPQESAKDIAENAQKSAQSLANDAQESAKNLANDAQERAANVGETISEGAKSAADKAKPSDVKRNF